MSWNGSGWYQDTSGGGGSGDFVGPGSSTDNALMRFDGTTGKLGQNSVGILTDAGVLSGLTGLTVDNLNFDGNTIISTDANGNISLTPNGTGFVNVEGIRILRHLYKKDLGGTCELSNTTSTPFTPTNGTPLHYNTIKPATRYVEGYQFKIEGYTSTGDVEIAMYSGATSGDLTLVANSSITTNITSTGFKQASLATPITLAASTQYYIAILPISGSFTMLQSQTFRSSSSIASTGTAGASVLPSTESTRNSASAVPYIQLY